MNAFKTELHALVARHIAAAPLAHMLRLVESLVDEPRVEASPQVLDVRPRFVKLGTDGQPTDGDHVAVYDHTTQLVWTAEPLGGGEDMTHAEAVAVCASLNVLDAMDWRLPTVRDLLSIVDYERYDPAVDSDVFKGPYGWTWSSTIARSPSGCAWYVGLGGGDCLRNGRGSRNHVLAVRAGQSLDFRF